MFKNVALVSALLIGLSGCASFANSPNDVAANVNAAVTDTQTVSNGLVAIAKDVVSTAAALLTPVTTIVSGAGVYVVGK